MSTDKAFSTFRALDLALEALEYIENNYMSLPKSGSEAINAIKQARAAPVQSCYCPNCEAMGKELAALKAQPAPVQEPQRYSPDGEGGMEVDSLGAYVKLQDVTTPPAQPAVQREHITDGRQCWCNPDIDYVDPETGAAVIVHKEPQ